MTRSILCGLLALVSVGVLGLTPVACQSGGVGDPCTPEDEFQGDFAGFKLEESPIESRSFQCQSRICLVNHFQGRVSCPLGQAAPIQCDPANKGSECTGGGSCAVSEIFAPSCSVCKGSDPSCVPVDCPYPSAQACDTGNCTTGNCPGSCTCTNEITVGGVKYACEASDTQNASSPKVLKSYVCHSTNNCQTAADGTTKANEGKDCCVPGTDQPVSVPVCGQCDNTTTTRNALNAVYCTCRCCQPCCDPSAKKCTTDMDCGTDSSLHCNGTVCVAQGDNCSSDTSTCGPACDPNYNYCSCPSGFTCSEIRTNVGLGYNELAGAYCIKTGSAYPGPSSCGTVPGHYDSSCDGIPGSPSAADGGM